MIQIRKAVDADYNFIYDSWLRNYRRSRTNDHQGSDEYYPEQREKISSALATCSVLVACNIEDADQIFGYVVFERPNHLHYVMVKHVYRRMGICNRLMREAFAEALAHGDSIYTDSITFKLTILKNKYNVAYKEKIK